MNPNGSLRDRFPANARILVIKLRSIGDVVYNTSVYTPLKRAFPRGHLTVLVEPASYDLVRSHPDVDEVLVFKKGSFFQQAEFYLKLFLARYDVVIDMHEGTRGAVMCFLSRARFRVGNRFARRSFLYNAKVDFSHLHPQYPLDYQAALIRAMGIGMDRAAPAIHLSPESERSARALLAEKGLSPGVDYGVVHCGTRKIYDQWQYEKFAELVRRLPKQYGIQAVLTCGPGEEAHAEKVIDHLGPNEAVAFLVTSLQELAFITRGARFAVCHNGGYMHLASSLGTPVVALFGVVNPRVWKPLGERDQVLYKNLECSPCNGTTRKPECYNGDAECKRRIGVEDVLEGIDRILAGKAGGREDLPLETGR